MQTIIVIVDEDKQMIESTIILEVYSKAGDL